MIICIETSTEVCSVALCDSSGVISLKESMDSRSHASLLTVFIDQLMEENGLMPSSLKAVAVSKGPGSYTGLRIGVSAAKGFAYGASIPLIGIETPFSMFMGATGKNHEDEDCKKIWCPMIDAKRMEVYYAMYNCRGEIVRNIAAEIITPDSFSELREKNEIILFGTGAAKLKDVLSGKGITFLEDFHMSAAHMFKPAFEALNQNRIENIAYFEPLYLKDFITTKPKKNILGGSLA